MRAVESYKMLEVTVGTRRARQLCRAVLVSRAAHRLGGPGWSAMDPPSLERLAGAMVTVTTANDVLSWAGIGPSRAESLLAEFETVASELGDAYAERDLTCPPEWAVEQSTSASLYCLVRERRPARMIETGIANGHSSFVILSAMRKNAMGHLASIDVRHDVGGLVSEDLAKRWTKVIIDGQRPGLDLLEQRLGEHRPVEVFFHDGDHRFLGQMLDYKLASRLLTTDGMLISDDISTTGAWLDAYETGLLGKDGLVLFDRRKAVGFARPG